MMSFSMCKHEGYATAERRWEGVGPYYAMFPTKFAYRAVQTFSAPGDVLLDPFAGRASSVYAAAIQGRSGLGIEINPVGWIYGKVKLNPAPLGNVLARLEAIDAIKRELWREAKNLPPFFSECFSTSVLQFLVAARAQLNWLRNSTDRTLMCIILIYLHGKYGQALSNQMRQCKSMSPDYCINWWRKRRLKPPVIDSLSFLRQRIEWRYKHGPPRTERSHVILGNSVHVLPKVVTDVEKGIQRRPKFLLTSPPYYGIANYHYDQWLRLWLLGDHSRPHAKDPEFCGKFGSKESYSKNLARVFELAAEVCSKDATILVRTDARPFTLETTIQALQLAFPKKRVSVQADTGSWQSQTMLFGNFKAQKEVDVLLR